MIIAVSAFLYTSNVLNAAAYVSDHPAPICNPPALSDVRVTNITFSSVRFSCTQNGDVYQFRYSLNNCVPKPGCYNWQTIIADANGIAEVTDLLHGNNYVVEARIFCNGSWSNWTSPKEFRTDYCSSPIPELFVTVTTFTTARLMTDFINKERYEFAYRVQGSGNGSWIYKESPIYRVDLEDLEVGTAYEFRIRVRCDGYSWSDWSGISHFTTKSCPTQSVNVTSISYNSVTLNCGTPNKAGYNYRYRPVGSNSWTEVFSYEPTGNRYPVDGLTQGTEYEVQCRIKCGSEEDAWSSWSASTSFTTEACVSPKNLRRKRTRMDQVIMNCDHPGDPERYQWQWQVEGKTKWRFKNQTESKLTLDHPTILPGTKYTFRVKAECASVTTAGSSVWGNWSREVNVTTDCDAIPSDRISVDEITPNSAKITCEISGAVLYVFELIDPVTGSKRQNSGTGHFSVFDKLTTGKTYQYRIRMTCTYGQTEWAEGEFSTLAVCDPPKPTSLNSLDVSHNGIILQCTENAAKYEFRYRKSMDVIWTTKPGKQNGMVNLVGLESKQEYIWQCRILCNGVWSDWSTDRTFRTLCAPPVLSEIEAKNITADGARLLCHITGYNKYQFRYKKEAENTWYPVIDRNVNYADLTLLDANTKYEYQIRYECDGQFTFWSSSGFFQTLQDACIAAEISDFRAYDITKHSAILEGYPSEDSPLFRWKQTSAVNWQVVAPDPGKDEVLISSLQPGTTYEYQHVYKCPMIAVVTDWSASKYFTSLQDTTCDPVAINQFNAVEIHSTYAYLECYVQSTNGSGDFYDFRYRESGAASWHELEPGDYRIKIENLLPGTQYEYQVRVKCDGVFTPWSQTKIFITLEDNMDSDCDSISENDYVAVWISDTSADLHIYIQGAKLYDFRYRESTESGWTDVDEDANNSREVPGLKPGTEYEYQVRYWCDTAFTPWSSSKFFMTRTFDMTCDAPRVETLSSRDSTDNMVILKCSLNQVREYQFRYQSKGDSTWITLNSSQNNENVAENLAPDENYAFQCRIMCMETGFSEWSDTVYFKSPVTTSSRDFTTLKWNVYPIPATEYINIQTGNGSKPYDLTLYDITGKLVLQVEEHRSPLYRLDFQLMPGIYILVCRQGEALGIRKVVVQ